MFSQKPKFSVFSFRLANVLLILLLSVSMIGLLAEPKKGVHEDVFEYKVKKNDTLSKIAKEFLQDPRNWKELLKYNEIPNPSLIREGTTLFIPGFLRKDTISATGERIEPNSGPVAIADFQKGQVQYSRDFAPNGLPASWNKLSKDQILNTEDWIQTGANSSSKLLFNKNGTVVELREKTLTRILKMNADSMSNFKMNKDGSILELKSGYLEAKVPPKKAGDEIRKFTVVTPTAVVGVRGTELYVNMVDPDTTAVGCYKGELEVSAEGKTVAVPAGFGTNVVRGQAPSKPEKLPEKVELE
ncbi:LysM peptidoglycan-binding domain-containing protein [Leptospira langatensis]|uniref:LysM peptidoglycan-binding domain-containing protein n=1 Tax=Leptospira langatensis TaxID=2484983 RepID=A0A5F1ZQU2_9LEPT|nr:LysM peptidoglycan-binding domain-containing protein [Leptospira langatensis]TGK02774.1 LysM peptidoglycan-binding domain-containing protein [Leptospira langatensis]TGL40021.1 LysM peptidoglycan-binding domain-containing protein [Leptospira langatensis]